MNASSGQWALKRLTIRYSETGGSSLGTRFYFRHLLENWKTKNPQVEVVTSHSQFEHPNVTAEWISGESHETSMANLQPKQIENLLNFYRNSHGANLYLRHGGPRVWTERRSIQGLWQPSLEGSLKGLKWFHQGIPFGGSGRRQNRRILRYSPASVKLANDHYNGLTSGRWGPNEMHGCPVDSGFSKDKLSEIFRQPFNTRND
jgi:large subunit ribosomal protein L43